MQVTLKHRVKRKQTTFELNMRNASAPCRPNWGNSRLQKWNIWNFYGISHTLKSSWKHSSMTLWKWRNWRWSHNNLMFCRSFVVYFAKHWLLSLPTVAIHRSISWRGFHKARRTESDCWVFAEGQQAPFHQLGGLGSAVGCPSGVRSRSPVVQWFLPERDYVTFGSLLSQFRLSSVCLSSVVCLSVVCRL